MNNKTMMKFVINIVFLSCCAIQMFAQENGEKKPSTLAFHVFYNDFETVRQIRTGSLKQVLSNGQWKEIGDMQMGFGFNYLKGISKRIDAVATIGGSSTDYLFRNGTTKGSSKLLMDANFLINMKLLTDRHALVPYISAGPGVSLYDRKTGYYGAAGIGVQVNLFGEAFVLAGTQARVAISPGVNHHFQHSIGIGTRVGKKKAIIPPVNDIIATEVVSMAKAIELPIKNILVIVTDQQTGLLLSNAEIVLSGPQGKIKGLSDGDGRLYFNAVQAADYTLSGMLHGITTAVQNILKNSFDVPGQQIIIRVSHNDLRFTLNGNVLNKSSHNAEGDVEINVDNISQAKGIKLLSKHEDGSFSVQLEPDSDFTISGKKNGFISNIERVSTKTLNRSTALYVKLELGIEEAARDKIISLRNIYYDTGSSKLRPEASSDLEKLIKFLTDNPDVIVEIASHSDSRGSEASNLILSQARARGVAGYLKQSGIGENRLIPRGYGETQLVDNCMIDIACIAAAHAQNRRTEFKVIGKLGN